MFFIRHNIGKNKEPAHDLGFLSHSLSSARDETMAPSLICTEHFKRRKCFTMKSSKNCPEHAARIKATRLLKADNLA